MNRRYFLAGALALGVAPAGAEPAFKRLVALLVDLPGFEGRKADGMSLEGGEGRLTTASRFYVRDSASLHVTVLSGPTAASPLGALDDSLKVETATGHVTSGEIDGFRVMKTYNSEQKSGALLIGLDKETMLTVDYRALEEDEAVALARRFDWKALAAAAK